MSEECTPFQSSSRAPIPLVEGSIPLPINVAAVYTLAIFIACPCTPCRVVYIPHDECWRDVHLSNIHRVRLYPLSRGLHKSRSILEGYRPFSYSSRAPIPPCKGFIPLAMNVRGVYTLPIFMACPYTPFRLVYTRRDQCCRGVQPSNIYRVPVCPLSNGLYPLR